MAQQFKTVDFVRLEVETDTDGLSNMLQNPSGELGGWGWVTPLGSSFMQAFSGQLGFVNLLAGASYFYSEAMPINAGQWASASWVALSGQIGLPPSNVPGGWFRARFEWLDASQAVLSAAPQTPYLARNGGRTTLAPAQAPASTAYVRLRFDLFATNTGTNHVGAHTLNFNEATVAKAATSDELGSLRVNLVTNPSFETNTTGWLASTATLASSTDFAAVGSRSLKATKTSSPGSPVTVRSDPMFPVVGNTSYTLQARFRPTVAGRSASLVANWYNGATFVSSRTISAAAAANAWSTLSNTVISPPTATFVQIWAVLEGPSGMPLTEVCYFDAVMLEQASTVEAYFDGSTADAGGWEYDWTGAANASTSTAISSNLPYIAPVSYFDVLPDSHQIRISREGLNVGRLGATILSSELDPSQSTLIRPGKRARLSSLVDGGWETILGGKLLEADVTYELKDPKVPESKRARIEVVIVDPTQILANAGRPEGVATIPALPFVLEGAGVPWSVNGSGNQIATAPVTTYNESAKALDQVALTRDTALGFAWVSRVGVLNVWDRDEIASGSPVLLNESAYSSIDLSFSTKDAINEVQITVQSAGTDGSTIETVYGPYVDAASVEEWGRYRKEFTVTGLDSAAVDALAATILTANVQPRIRVNSITIPIDTVERLEAHALRDLYDEVNVVLDQLGVDDTLRVTGIDHTIDTTKWLLTLRFSEDGGVAQPTVQPPVQSGARPDVGVVELFAGPVDQIPTTKLLCDGSSHAVADYPYLFAVIGYTFGGAGANFSVPNLTDRFPIGAGTKARGTTGGAPSVTLAANNLPPHVHGIARQAGANTGGGTNIALGNAVAGPLGGTQANATTHDPVDILNPWLSLWFIIRAA
ncbi:hypothetical protein ASE01_20115 [Nocardioides sp. Root190]|uniref:tail fiber protein n=1 Tax=Nocardioides sp. Root190 TaxID=1736488 RepID=UPI0006F67476|nr:tail fiber protein [Nocardioides sp. Root190]KRB73083.1 hypothetical protein ASE01_20115 [Nocardioides sp. Root190]